MAQFEKRDLSHRVAEALRTSIAQGAVGDLMPSIRSMALNLGVSVPSVSKAFLLLQKEGILESCGERRRWRILARPRAAARKGRINLKSEIDARKTGRLLFLTSLPMNEWLAHSVEVYADIVTVMSSLGWEVVHRVMVFQDAKAPRKVWNELLEQESPDVMVVLTGTPVVAAWAKSHSVPTLFLGGGCEPYSLPMVSVSMSGVVEELTRKLIDLGHRHIVMPLCGRTSGFQERIKQSIQAAIDSMPSSGAVAHALESPYSAPEVLYDVLKKHWRHWRPDAIMLLDWREFVTTSSFFRDIRISIPADVSVALLSSENSMEWHLPKLSHYEFSNMKLAKAVARWAVNVGNDSTSATRVTMRAQWRKGGSILDRR